MIYFLIFFTLIISPQTLKAGGGLESSFSTQKSNEKIIKVNVEFGGGTIKIQSDDENNIFRGNTTFSKKEYKPKVNYETIDDSLGYLQIFPAEKTINIFDSKDLKKNKWNLFFSTEIPYEFNFEFGASDAKLDFTNIQIQTLKIENGVGKLVFDCQETNKTSLKELQIDSGVGEMVFNNLLNTNFEKFCFDGGLGDYVLNFTGKSNQKKASAVVNVGLAEVEILLEKGISVEITKEASFLSKVNLDDFEKVGAELYRNANFDRKDFVLYLKIEVGFGKIKVRTKD